MRKREIDQAFTVALESVRHIASNSCRADIEKNINKNKYSRVSVRD